jgi:hypothetical protein
MSDAWNQRCAELLANYIDHPRLHRRFVELINEVNARATFERRHYGREQTRPTPDDLMHQALVEYQEWARAEITLREEERRRKAENDRFNAMSREEQDAYMNAKMIEERRMREHPPVTLEEFHQWKGRMRYEINSYPGLDIEEIILLFTNACKVARAKADAQGRFQYPFPPALLCNALHQAYAERIADEHFDDRGRPKTLTRHERDEARRDLTAIQKFRAYIEKKYHVFHH